MIIGTAGFTSMASMLALEDHGLDARRRGPGDGRHRRRGLPDGRRLPRRDGLPSRRLYRFSIDEAPWLSSAVRHASLAATRSATDRASAGSERWSGAIDCIGGDDAAPDSSITLATARRRGERTRRGDRTQHHHLSLHHAQRQPARHRRRRGITHDARESGRPSARSHRSSTSPPS
jgi:hypothetical protein